MEQETEFVEHDQDHVEHDNDQKNNDVKHEVVEKDQKSSDNSSPFEDRSRESLIDEIKALREESKSRRTTLAKTSKTLEQRIAALEETNRAQSEELRVAKIKAMGVPEDKIDLIKSIDDEEIALEIAKVLAVKDEPKATVTHDKNLLTGVKKTTIAENPALGFMQAIKNI